MVKRAWGRRVETALVVVTTLSLVGPARAAAANLWVDGSNPACSDAQPREQVTEATPWCTVAVATLEPLIVPFINEFPLV